MHCLDGCMRRLKTVGLQGMMVACPLQNSLYFGESVFELRFTCDIAVPLVRLFLRLSMHVIFNMMGTVATNQQQMFSSLKYF